MLFHRVLSVEIWLTKGYLNRINLKSLSAISGVSIPGEGKIITKPRDKYMIWMFKEEQGGQYRWADPNNGWRNEEYVIRSEKIQWTQLCVISSAIIRALIFFSHGKDRELLKILRNNVNLSYIQMKSMATLRKVKLEG